MTPWEQYKAGLITKSKYNYVCSPYDSARDCERNKIWRENNKERRQRYVQQNSARFAAYNIKRAKRENQATPKWLTVEQWDRMNAIYEMARLLTRLTGQLYHVDHLWPLNGQNSCGLHVPWNLRVITQAENDSKGKAEPDGRNPLVKRDACTSTVAINLLPTGGHNAQGYECIHHV